MSSSNLSTISHLKLAFIGGGQMASALIAGLLRAGTHASKINVVEPMQAQRAHLEKTFGVRTSAVAGPELRSADFVIWSVKPQVMREAVNFTKQYLGESLHISIAAGLSLQTLSGWIESDRVVRAMPNTAALVGAGVTGMVAAHGVSSSDRVLVQDVLAGAGHCFWVESDERIDAVTAVTGSGPAYIFHFLEAYQAAAECLGFDSDQAKDLVLKTAAGAVKQALEGNKAFAVLRENVTSLKGTTEAALAVLDSQQTPKSLEAALRAAYDRAGEISAELASHRQ